MATTSLKSSLRQHQRRALQKCRTFIAANPVRKSALMSLPTGTGKTAIIAAASATAADHGVSLVVCPFDALCEQLIADIGSRTWDKINIASYGPTPEVLRLMPSDLPNKLDPTPGARRVLVATMKAVADAHSNNVQLYDALAQKVSVVFVDEGHREPAPTWARALRGLKKPMILFSATPYRNDLRHFNVHNDYIERMSFKNAVQARIIRDVQLHVDLRSTSVAAFARSFADTVRKLEDGGKIAANWKAMIHCETAANVEKMHDELKKIPWVRDLGVLAFHDTFGTKHSTKMVRVPNLRARKERFLVHQYKLMEGIDEPAVQVLGMYEPFSNARALVQQVGRIVRNPENTAQPAHLLIAESDRKTAKQWKSFRDFDDELDNLPLTDHDIVKTLLAAVPKFDYILGAFRKRVPDDFKISFEKELLVRRSAIVFRHPSISPAAGLGNVVDGVRESLISADRWIAAEMADGVSDRDGAGHLFIAAIVSPSPLLQNSAFIELKFSATVVRQVGDLLFLADSEGGSFLDLEELVDGALEEIDLTRLIAGPGSRLTGMSALNSDVGPRALRSRSSSGYNLGESAPYLADHQYVLGRIQGYAGKQYRSIGIARSRISVGRGDLVPVADFAAWTKEIAIEIKASKSRVPLPFVERFSRPISAPAAKDAKPSHILLSIEGLVDRYEHPSYPNLDIVKTTELASEVRDLPAGHELDMPYGFDIEVAGTRTVGLKYVPSRKRYVLKSEFLEQFKNASNPKETLLAKLNANQAFRIVPVAPETFYVQKKFFATDLNLDPGRRGQLLLDLLYPIPELAIATSEKGNTRKGPAGRWGDNSVFDIIDRGLQGKIGKPFLSQTYDLLACTDLGREIADFVAVDKARSQLIFLHGKAGKSLFSVSSLHVVVAQAIKNLHNVAAGSRQLEGELQVIKKQWKVDGKTCVRIRAGTEAVFLREAKRVSSSPNGQREVWLVLGALLSKSKASTQLKTKSASPEVIQMFMLLSSLYSDCASVGATLRVFCSP